MNTLNDHVPEEKGSGQSLIKIAPLKIEIAGRSISGFWLFLFLCVLGFCVAWTFSETNVRVIHPESKLSVLELEQRVVKVDGVEKNIWKLKDASHVGITFVGFARLGIDLSKAKFDLNRRSRLLTITLPKPEVTEVNVTEANGWERKTNPQDAKKIDQLECELYNSALDDFRKLAEDPFYKDTANQLAKLVLRAYYRKNYSNLIVEFK